MSEKPTADLNETMESLSLGDASGLPKRWENDSIDPKESIRNFLADWPQFQKTLDAPGHQVVTDASGKMRLKPNDWHSLDAVGEKFEEETKLEFVNLSRVVAADDSDEPVPGQWVTTRMAGKLREEVAFVTVPEAEVAALEAKGWEVWYPPPPAFNLNEGYRDTRGKLPRPVDVITTDKPAADTEHYLVRGQEYVRRNWVKGEWKQGDLIGKNGSDPETKAQSASYAAPDCWDKISDNRVATSTGHVHQYDRPPNVCVGWGGYDKFDHWQSSGRQITKDMVKKGEWSTSLLEPFNFVDESGKVVETVTPVLEQKDLPLRPKKPKTLYELLNEKEARKKKEPAKRTLAWPGTRKNAE